MLKDIKICTISKNGIVNILRNDLLPFDIYLEEENDFDTCVNNLVNFYAWCANRILSIDRTNAKAILNSVNLKQVTTDKDKAAIALQFKCLSLRDSYWVTDNISDKWSTLNLFENSLNNIIDISLLGKYLTVTNEKLVIDDLSLIQQGSLKLLLKLVEESKIPIILLSSFDNIDKILLSRIKTYIRFDEPIKSDFLSLSDFYDVLSNKDFKDSKQSDKLTFYRDKCPMYLELDYYINTSSNKNKLLSILSGE
jgi:hypothetical protein